MIVRAAVMIDDLRQKCVWSIPCHRHCDAFYILKMMNYKRDIDYKEIAQGFLDEHDNFYNRVDAWKHAMANNQIIDPCLNDKIQPIELYSEDLW